MKHTLVFLLALMATISCIGVARAAETEISASGTGTISLPPDVAIIRAEVQTNAATATEATSQNNALYDQVIAALQKLGVDRRDVSLDLYNVRYLPPNVSRANPFQPVGYTVERTFSITVRAISRVGTITNASLSAGATSIGGISFRLSAEDAVRAQATAKAVADARATAQTLAKAGGLHIVGIKAMQVGAFPGIPIGVGLRTIAHVSAYSGQPTNLDESNVVVSVDVGVVFLAKP
jgi:uncharacterized protein YggE